MTSRRRRRPSTCRPSWKEQSVTPATSTTSGSAPRLARNWRSRSAHRSWARRTSTPAWTFATPRARWCSPACAAQDAKVGTVDTKVIQLAQEVLGKLDQEGEYTLRVRDLTSFQGSPEHAYRVLVRPQIPHAGAVRVEPDGPVNLPAGSRRRLTFNTSGKEELRWRTRLLCGRASPGGAGFRRRERVPRSTSLRDSNAPCSLMPQVLHVWGLPSVGEKSGSAFLVAEFPVMVVRK